MMNMRHSAFEIARFGSMILYKNVVSAVFVKRINRFTAEVMIGDAREIVHVKNTRHPLAR